MLCVCSIVNRTNLLVPILDYLRVNGYNHKDILLQTKEHIYLLGLYLAFFMVIYPTHSHFSHSLTWLKNACTLHLWSRKLRSWTTLVLQAALGTKSNHGPQVVIVWKSPRKCAWNTVFNIDIPDNSYSLRYSLHMLPPCSRCFRMGVNSTMGCVKVAWLCGKGLNMSVFLTYIAY